jgi:acyl-CoA synthetase (AMP-forming)/AMP-acid ligase II
MEKLATKWIGKAEPAVILDGQEIWFTDIQERTRKHLDGIMAGDVVALIGDFNAESIADMIHLIDIGVILVPLSPLTEEEHRYFFDVAKVNWVVRNGLKTRISPRKSDPLLDQLRYLNHAGLVLFSSGTTGRPKAILHDLTLFLKRFETPRPTYRTLAFLLFDHIGGINTLLHTLFNSGTIICTSRRDIKNVIAICQKYKIEVLPTTPTFLRLLLISGVIPREIPETLKVITYGTERMDESTLRRLCELLPAVDFRQTFGMSELGILRVKSKARDSLLMKIGGEGIEWKVENDLLLIRSETKMLGYLNAPSPFDKDGWYQTNDLVEVYGDYIKVVGRNNDVVNVGGLKFLLSEVELIAYENENVELATAKSASNPITGQHVEITIQLKVSSRHSKEDLRNYFELTLPTHMRPRRIFLETVKVGHRHKKL